MGCDDSREDIEEKIVYARLERDQIRRERNLLINQLRICTGEEYHPEPIPDYIDIDYIKEQKRKKIEKKVKKAVKEEAARQKEEEKRQKELEEEMKRLEKEGYDEEFLYQPLSLKVKNKISELDDIYNLNYVLQKKDLNENKDQNEDNEEEIDENNNNKKKSILKKNKKDKKVKFKDNLIENDEDNNDDNENEDNDNNEIDNDIIQKVDARIATKTASINSAIGGGNNKNNIKKRISKNNSNMDDDSKSIPYFTPHLQPND